MLIASVTSSLSYYILNEITTAYLAAALSCFFVSILIRRATKPNHTSQENLHQKPSTMHFLYMMLIVTSSYQVMSWYLDQKKTRFWSVKILLIIPQAAGLLYDSVRYPPPGELIRIHNATHHLYCRGSDTREVAVALAGLPWSSIAFRDSLANPPMTVCTHDRLGYGWSSAATDQSRDV